MACKLFGADRAELKRRRKGGACQATPHRGQFRMAVRYRLAPGHGQ